MDFSLNDIQLMLADSIDKFIANDYDFDTRQKYAASEAGFSFDVWQTFAELGWTAVPFSEDDGGLGGNPVDTMVVMERFGRGLVVEPYLANVLLAGGVLKRVANDAQKNEYLHRMIRGELHVSLAFAEPHSRYDLAKVNTKAVPDGNAWRLSGKKSYVLNGRNAGVLIIPARVSDGRNLSNGISLFLVDAKSDGVAIQDYATVDGHQAADIDLENVAVGADALLGEADSGLDALVETIDEATLAVCAEAVGIMQLMQDKTVEYSKNRVQFGVPISSFQALQHRMVDMLTNCEQSRSLLMWATMVNAEQSDESRTAVSAIKYMVGTTGRNVGEEAVQLHGGMGVTWELDIAHYFKRLIAIGQMFGNADWHLDRLAA